MLIRIIRETKGIFLESEAFREKLSTAMRVVGSYYREKLLRIWESFALSRKWVNIIWKGRVRVWREDPL